MSCVEPSHRPSQPPSQQSRWIGATPWALEQAAQRRLQLPHFDRPQAYLYHVLHRQILHIRDERHSVLFEELRHVELVAREPRGEVLGEHARGAAVLPARSPLPQTDSEVK